ncbi:TPA: PilN domain-containing protein [Pseudomonas putida]|nr:PilN domain-containing protein [Pseudomonas putida]
MMRLNLLPWRERQRRSMLRRFQWMLLGSAVLALCCVMLIDQLARQRAQQQALSNVSRQSDLALFDQRLEQHADVRAAHDAAQQQAVVLARLRADQGVLPALFEDLEAALPTGLQLTELKLADGRLQVTGLAVSGAVVAQFMRDLERSAVLQGLELKHVKSMPTGDQFVLTARVSAFWS